MPFLASGHVQVATAQLFLAGHYFKVFALGKFLDLLWEPALAANGKYSCSHPHRHHHCGL